MLTKKFSVIASLCLVLSLAGCTSLAPKSSSESINTVITSSGLSAHIELMQTPLQHIFKKLNSAQKTDTANRFLAVLPPELIAAMTARLTNILAPAKLHNALHAALEKNLSPQELANVTAFYRSPAGKSVVALERGEPLATAMPSSPRLSHYQTPSHQAMLTMLANNTGVSQAASTLAQHALNDAINLAVEKGCFGLNEIPFAGMMVSVMKKSQLRALEKSINEKIKTQYQILNTADATAYLQFTQSSAGKKFFSARTAVMNRAAEEAGDALNQELPARVAELCAQTNARLI